MTEGGAHVLVVDDEPQILRGLRVVLRSAGFQVAQAATKQEALDAVAVRPPDVMILDLVLPDGSGVDVCEEVRRWSDQAVRDRGAHRPHPRGAAPPRRRRRPRPRGPDRGR
jgi:CheY-like chemotaxis protein